MTRRMSNLKNEYMHAEILASGFRFIIFLAATNTGQCTTTLHNGQNARQWRIQYIFLVEFEIRLSILTIFIHMPPQKHPISQ